MPQHCKVVGPYLLVSKDYSRTFQTPSGLRTFRILCYGARNASGLISTFSNGVAILDEDRSCVLCDGIQQTASGYDQPTRGALECLAFLRHCQWGEFEAFVNTHERSRYQLAA